jgi:D-beta-D-heptose 7-phosphate kinase / D-beta-D-heptose 1-phosphate adenosyltransferase
LLQRASELGDVLVVGLNSDASIRRIKGNGRPIIPQDDRRFMLEALRCVDRVVLFNDDSPLPLVHRLLPEVYVKGAGYSFDNSKTARFMRDAGREVVFLPPLADCSSSAIMAELGA